MPETAYQSFLKANRERLSTAPAAPQLSPKPVSVPLPDAHPRVDETHPEADSRPEAGKDW